MPHEPTPTPALVDVEMLRGHLLLEPGAEAFFRQLVGVFADHSAGQLETLASAVAEGRLEEVAEIAHGLKGAAVAIGGAALGAAAARLEVAARRGDEGATRAAFEGFGALREGTLEALRAVQEG